MMFGAKRPLGVGTKYSAHQPTELFYQSSRTLRSDRSNNEEKIPTPCKCVRVCLVLLISWSTGSGRGPERTMPD